MSDATTPTSVMTAEVAGAPAPLRGRSFGLLGLVLAFLLQAGLLGWMVLDRALLLARGTEIRLPVIPVDPRDLLRGDYVVLSYALSRLDAGELAGEDAFKDGQTIYVALHRDGGAWKPAALHATAPAGGGLFLKGKVEDVQKGAGGDCRGGCRAYRVAYNLENFFVPEGHGLALEQLRNDQRIEVDAAVGRDGRAALRRLLVDGAVRYEDTLF